MSHLDVSALIAALRAAPEEFELCGGWLCHTRAGHRVHINPGGRIEIQAAGDCAVLTAQSDSQPELAGCVRRWEAEYWRALLINREFAARFARRPMALRLLTALTGRLHRWLLKRGNERVTVGKLSRIR